MLTDISVDDAIVSDDERDVDSSVLDGKLIVDVISVLEIASVLVSVIESDTVVLSVSVEDIDTVVKSIEVVLSLFSVLETADDDEISTEDDIFPSLVIVSVWSVSVWDVIVVGSGDIDGDADETGVTVSTIEKISIVVGMSIVVGSVVEISVVDISVVDISVVEIMVEDSKVLDKSFEMLGIFVVLALGNLSWASKMACLFLRLVGEVVVIEFSFFSVDVAFISEGTVLPFSVFIESVVNLIDSSSNFIVFFESVSVILSSGDCA